MAVNGNPEKASGSTHLSRASSVHDDLVHWSNKAF